jgi:hypothetical protein
MKTNMRKTIAMLFLLLASRSGYSQDPVHWEFKSQKISNEVYEMHFIARIDQPWHIYSMANADGSGVATAFNYSKNPLLQLKEPANEKGNLVTGKDQQTGIELRYYEKFVEFMQVVVKVKSNAKTKISGSIIYVACTETRCLPPASANFHFVLN